MKATTSPWRTDGFAGLSASFAIPEPGTTRTSSEADAPRTDAVSVERPGARPVIVPSPSTATILGRLDCQRTASSVRSLALE